MINHEKIKNDVKRVIEYSQNFSPNVDALMKNWWDAKKDICREYFHGELIREIPEPVQFELCTRTKLEKIGDFIDRMYLLTRSEEFADFLNKTCTAESFFTNSLQEDYVKKDGKVIQAGTKYVKSFKFFIDNGDLLAEIQNAASAIIQSNCVKGKLCFSIHPLDYLSISENNFNWRSCHALDGEFRAGNLSYMCDKSTIICYLKSEEDTRLARFPSDLPWNNKKWRCLLFLSDNHNAMFAGRQYPFFADEALETIREPLLDLLNVEAPSPWYGERWSHWHDDEIGDGFEYREHSDHDGCWLGDFRFYVLDNNIYRSTQLITDAKGSRHYNDLLNSSCYRPYYMFAKSPYSGPKDIHFSIGSAVDCLMCGDGYIASIDTMMCPNCECEYGDSENEDYAHCDCCGARFWSGDGTWVDDDWFVCPSCYDRECFVCEECDEVFYNSEKHFVNGKFVCERCLQEIEEENADGTWPDSER